MGFFRDPTNAIRARRKRKVMNWRKGCGGVWSQQQKRQRNRVFEAEGAIAVLIRRWLKSLASEGSNNSTNLAGLKAVVEQMASLKPLTKRSVFVDFGSGAGIPCIYVAKRFGCRTVGVEKDVKLVELARTYAEDAGVSDLCEFVCTPFLRRLKTGGLNNREQLIFMCWMLFTGQKVGTICSTC